MNRVALYHTDKELRKNNVKMRRKYFKRLRKEMKMHGISAVEILDLESLIEGIEAQEKGWGTAYMGFNRIDTMHVNDEAFLDMSSDGLMDASIKSFISILKIPGSVMKSRSWLSHRDQIIVGLTHMLDSIKASYRLIDGSIYLYKEDKKDREPVAVAMITPYFMSSNIFLSIQEIKDSIELVKAYVIAYETLDDVLRDTILDVKGMLVPYTMTKMTNKDDMHN